MSNIFIGLKKTCLGVLGRGEREKQHETGSQERGGIEIEITVLHSRCSLLRLNTHHYSHRPLLIKNNTKYKSTY